jgi:hypothetical protein
MKTRTRFLITSSILVLVLTVGWEDRSSTPPPVRFAKMYLYDQTLYISELTRGVRQLDISIPQSPADRGLIKIDENHDTALRGTPDGRRILYADSYADLVVLDVTNPSVPFMVDTLRNIFGQAYAMRWGDNLPFGQWEGVPMRRVGGWEGCMGCTETVMYEPIPTSEIATLDAAGRGSTTSRGGSMARFAVIDGYLYCVDYNQLYVFDIGDPTKPRFVNRTSIGWGIETIFPYGDYLFIGGQNGMYIYSKFDPRSPKFVSTYEHVRACDPVVVEGSLAYVTLRGGTRCGTVVSALHILDIVDLFKPKLLKSYPLPQPIGLDVRNKVAYVCDDSTGVYILDTSDLTTIRELARITDKPGYDTILHNDLLIVASPDAVSFYNASQPSTPMLLGRFQLPE